jgi:thiol-disulfide isomerase/thioredoxin
MRKLLEQLQKLDGDSPSPTASTTALTNYNKQRADLLAQLADASTIDNERQQWTRQMVDGITAAVQTGTFPSGIERLNSVLADVRKKLPKSPLLAYVSYRHLLAGYSVEMQQASNSERADVQKRWLRALEKFARDYPTADDTPDAILQLAISEEFSGEQTVARKWYARLVADYAKAAAGVRAVGAIRRLDLVGKTFNFNATGLNGGRIDAGSYRGKVLLVLFWATWCKPCTEDLPQMRELYKLHHAAGFEILGVNLDTAVDPVSGYLKQHKVSWPQIYEPGGLDSSPAREFGIISLPTLFLVDRNGKVVGRNVSVDDLKKQIPDLLKKKK